MVRTFSSINICIQTCLQPIDIIAFSFSLVDGHYLNLPVLDEDKNIVGLVDVLKLTYATLGQVSMLSVYVYSEYASGYFEN